MVAQKRALAMKMESFSQKYIAGEISLDVPQMIFFSIPIDRGWNAYVNGSPVPLIKANIGFMGLLLTPGTHHIELKYSVDHLPETATVSCLFFVGYVMIVLRKKFLKSLKTVFTHPDGQKT
jgi:uncharacterized membrane protein YfhO